MKKTFTLENETSELILGPIQDQYIIVSMGDADSARTVKVFLYTDQEDMFLYFNNLLESVPTSPEKKSWETVEEDLKFETANTPEGKTSLKVTLISEQGMPDEWTSEATFELDKKRLEELVHFINPSNSK